MLLAKLSSLNNLDGNWALGIGNWALGIGHWALGIGINFFTYASYPLPLNTVRLRIFRGNFGLLRRVRAACRFGRNRRLYGFLQWVNYLNRAVLPYL
jgi:hypothetical protein